MLKDGSVFLGNRKSAEERREKAKAGTAYFVFLVFAGIMLLAVGGIWLLSRSGPSGDRYDRLSPEGKNHVDQQMQKYDEVCARRADC